MYERRSKHIPLPTNFHSVEDKYTLCKPSYVHDVCFENIETDMYSPFPREETIINKHNYSFFFKQIMTFPMKKE